MSMEYLKTQLGTRTCKHWMDKKKIVWEVDKYNNQQCHRHKQCTNQSSHRQYNNQHVNITTSILCLNNIIISGVHQTKVMCGTIMICH